MPTDILVNNYQEKLGGLILDFVNLPFGHGKTNLYFNPYRIHGIRYFPDVNFSPVFSRISYVSRQPPLQIGNAAENSNFTSFSICRL